MDNTKEAASDYLGNVKEYLASFQVATGVFDRHNAKVNSLALCMYA